MELLSVGPSSGIPHVDCGGRLAKVGQLEKPYYQHVNLSVRSIYQLEKPYYQHVNLSGRSIYQLEKPYYQHVNLPARSICLDQNLAHSRLGKYRTDEVS